MSLFLPNIKISPETNLALRESNWDFSYISYDFLSASWHVRLASPHGQLTYSHQRHSLDLAILAALSEARTIPPPDYRPSVPESSPRPTIHDIF